MKKLFFTALVAIVAVGEVLTVNAIIYLSDSTPLQCSMDDWTFDCASTYSIPGNTPIWANTPASGPADGQIDQFDYDLAD